MQVATIANTVRHTLSKNSPAILTALAVTGTVSTAILATKATVQAMVKLHDEAWEEAFMTKDPYQSLSVVLTKTPKQELVKRFWTLYVPAVATCGVTIGCIIGANTVHTRRSAALMSAYSITETAFKEYQEKVVEQVGAPKEQKVRDAIAADRIASDPPSQNQVLVTGNGDVLCYEFITGRYFNSSMETLRKAQNDINSQILNEMYASQNDFFRAIGLPVTGAGETVGWNNDKRLDLTFSSILSEDSKPCLAVGYSILPFPQYDDLH